MAYRNNVSTFLNKISKSDELILEREAQNGKKDFGNESEVYEIDASILSQVHSSQLESSSFKHRITCGDYSWLCGEQTL